MRRLTIIVDASEYQISYAEAAKRLEISVQALRNKLAHHRKQTNADIVPLEELRSKPMRNIIRDHNGNRISQQDTADYLDIKVHKLNVLLTVVRGLYPRVRAGADIPIGLLEHELSVDGEILFHMGIIHGVEDENKYLGK